jgi:hypothetical protein
MISMSRAGRSDGRKGAGTVTDSTTQAAPTAAAPVQFSSMPAPPSLAGDLMETAEEIAEFLYGDRSKKAVRKVFYLTSEVEPANRPPIFKLSNQKLAARRSRLLRWIAEREAAATGSQAV